MAQISTHHARHPLTDEVATAADAGRPLTDGMAGAIASWYQTPRGHGATFAALASGLSVESDDLIVAIRYEQHLVQDASGLRNLDALARWADAAVSS